MLKPSGLAPTPEPGRPTGRGGNATAVRLQEAMGPRRGPLFLAQRALGAEAGWSCTWKSPVLSAANGGVWPAGVAMKRSSVAIRAVVGGAAVSDVVEVLSAGAVVPDEDHHRPGSPVLSTGSRRHRSSPVTEDPQAARAAPSRIPAAPPGPAAPRGPLRSTRRRAAVGVAAPEKVVVPRSAEHSGALFRRSRCWARPGIVKLLPATAPPRYRRRAFTARGPK